MSQPPLGALRGIFSNLGQLMGGKVAAGLLSLVYMVIAARILGVAEYGMLSLIHAYATFVGGVLAFSGYHAVVRFGADLVQQDIGASEKGLRHLVWFMAAVELAMAVLAIAVAIVCVPYAGRNMGWNATTTSFAPLYCFAILATVRTTPQGVLQLAGRFDLLGAHNVVMPAVRLIGTAAVLVFGGGLLAFLWVWLVASVFEGLSMWAMGIWQMGRMGLARIPLLAPTVTVEQHQGIVRFAAITNADITLREFAPRITPLILGWISGPVAAGLFALATRVGALLVQPAQLLGQAGYAIIARLVVSREWGEVDDAVRNSVRLVIAASLILAAGMAFFADEILQLVGGPQFAFGGNMLALVLIGRAFAAPAPTYSSSLTALGRPGISATANLIANIAMLPLLPPLLWWLGPDGAGWHVIAQSLALSAILAIAYRRTIWQATEADRG